MPKVYSEVYGCSANIADSEMMLGLLKQNGFQIVNNVEDADLNLIITCAVKNPTENRMVHRIKELSKSQKPLIVAGCLAKSQPNLIEKINPMASLIGPNSIGKITEAANGALVGKKNNFLEDTKLEKVTIPHVRTNPIIDIVEISSGCLSNCSFCSTKQARGNLFSYRPNSIREQIKSALNDGCKEIWLTSQDSSAYGRDLKIDLSDLLNGISKIDGDFFVRVGMMNPLHFKKVDIHNLIESFKNEKIFKFLHICLQSGSDNVLKIMRRGYSVKDFVSYIEEFRKEIPKITIMTDIIVGHPGEEDVDFKETIKILKKVKPNLSILSKYGSRPGTVSSKMKQVDFEIVNERSKILAKLMKKISFEQNKKWYGWEGEVIVDEKKENGFVGRNFAYKSIFINENLEIGEKINVKIKKIKPNFLIGEKQKF